MEQNQPKSLGQKWTDARPTKTVVFWSCAASMVVTMAEECGKLLMAITPA